MVVFVCAKWASWRWRIHLDAWHSPYNVCLCACVRTLDEPQPPRDGGCDHMFMTHPDRCDKCSNTSVSKRRVIMCNFLEGPLRDGCCDIHSKWEMDGQYKRGRNRQKITRDLGVRADINKQRLLVKQTDTYSELMTESFSPEPICKADWMEINSECVWMLCNHVYCLMSHVSKPWDL